MNNTRLRKRLFLGALGMLVVLIGIAVYSTVTNSARRGKVAATITVLPTGAAITLNGKSISQGTHYLKPGAYSLSAKASGYTANTKNYVLENNKPLAFNLLLDPDSPRAEKWYQDHQKLYTAIQAKEQAQLSSQAQQFSNQNPIITSLPFENYLYSIGYQKDPASDNDNDIILTIDAPDGYRNAAVNKIRELGYDPTNYKISFNDYTNPFLGQ